MVGMVEDGLPSSSVPLHVTGEPGKSNVQSGGALRCFAGDRRLPHGKRQNATAIAEITLRLLLILAFSSRQHDSHVKE